MGKTIGLQDLLVARNNYFDILNELGRDFSYGAPSIQRFLSPSNWSKFPEYIGDGKPYISNITWELSVTGERRFNMLFSPHAKTLVAAALLKDRK